MERDSRTEELLSSEDPKERLVGMLREQLVRQGLPPEGFDVLPEGSEPHQVSEPCTCGECERCTFYENRGKR
jgi:hypothetical protein